MSTATDFDMGRSLAMPGRDTSAAGKVSFILLLAAGSVVILALFARIMMEDLRHDEHMFVAAGAVFGRFDLYGDFSYSHLPNLALFLAGLFEAVGSDHYLLVARSSLFVTWLLFLFGMFLVTTSLSRNRLIGALAVLLLITNQLFISHVGMVVSNNIYAATLTLYGLFFFLLGIEKPARRPALIAVGGLMLSLGAGVKANFIIFVLPIVLVAFLVPRSLGWRDRFFSVVTPLAVGGVIGALPTFYYLAVHADVMIFNVFEFHMGPHRAYWSEPDNALGVTGATLPERVFYAYQLWTSGSTFLAFLGGLGLVVVVACYRGLSGVLSSFADWRVSLILALVITGIAICFPVMPSFPQYYMPPIPFAIVLIAALYGGLAIEEKRVAMPLLATLALATVILGGPRLIADLPAIAKPDRWTPIEVHKVAEDIATAVANSGQEGPLATLVPIYALEAGLDVYPELATGPFYYRIGDYLAPEERTAFRVTSPKTVAAMLDQTPPSAILIGYEGVLDEPFQQYGQEAGFRASPSTFGDDRYGSGRLLLSTNR